MPSNNNTPLRLASRLPTDPAALGELLDALEFRDLLTPDAPFAWPSAALASAAGLGFVRLAGARRRHGAGASTLPQSILAGLATGTAPFAFLAASNGEEVAIAVGTTPSRSAALGAAMHASLGGLEPRPLGIARAQLDFPSFGALAGVPAPPVADDGSPLDLLLDSMRGVPFLLMVHAVPEPVGSLRQNLDRLRAAAQEIDRTQLLLPQQANANRAAVRARELLDTWSRRLESGLAGGLWRTSIVFGSASADLVRHALAILSGELRSPKEDAVVPPRGLLCAPAPDGAPTDVNLLAAPELAAACVLPARDRAGFMLRDEVRFDVHHPSGEGATLGAVLDGDVVTSRHFTLDGATLCRHALVAGHTGSGKSTTARGLLLDLARQKVRFLVLEPAKGEYRQLAASLPDLCAFAVGAVPRPGEMPFVLNPFAFPEGFPLHTHIDFLKQVFIASFGLVPPTPYLLEGAIYRAYAAKGWDLATGQHPHGHDVLAFPTLSDLVEEIDAVVDAADYRGEVASNLRAALRTRIGNLCLGPKGLALNTRHSLPDELLFGSPVVLELKSLGSDEEKALVMGLVITRLYELREATGAGGSGDALRHLLVIEEAHRILKRTSERASDESNMAHQAIETFTNLLAELRAYGQGVLVVEQLPSKLAPEVVKHSGTKIVHRLTPRDDRDAVGDAMVLTEEQKRALAVLPTGEAVVHGEGMDGAIRVRVPARRTAEVDRAELASRPWRRIDEADAERLRSAVSRTWLAGVLDQSVVRRGADRVWLAAAAGLPVEPPLGQLAGDLRQLRVLDADGARGLIDLALDDALLRRALLFGWSGPELDHRRAILRMQGVAAAADSFRAALPGRPSCSRGCQLCYEGTRLAADHELHDDVAEAVEGSTDAWDGLLRQAVSDAARRQFGWEAPVPEALLACALDQVLARASVTRKSAEAVLRTLNATHHDDEGSGAAVAPSTVGDGRKA